MPRDLATARGLECVLDVPGSKLSVSLSWEANISATAAAPAPHPAAQAPDRCAATAERAPRRRLHALPSRPRSHLKVAKLAVGYWDRSAWPSCGSLWSSCACWLSTRRAASACAPPRPRPTAAGAPEPTTAGRGHGSAICSTHSVRSHAVCDSIQLRLASIRHGCAIVSALKLRVRCGGQRPKVP